MFTQVKHNNESIIRAALDAAREAGTPAVVAFRSEGEDCGAYCQVADVDAATVALFAFESGLLLHLWIGQITSVEGRAVA